MKVLLIDPPMFVMIEQHKNYFPYGLCSMATLLRQKGYDASVYDADHTTTLHSKSFKEIAESYDRYLEEDTFNKHPIWSQMAAFLEEFKPDLVGVSTLPVKYRSVKKTVQIVRAMSPNAKIVVGGRHATSNPEIFFALPEVDFVVRGEGEQTILDLCDLIDSAADISLYRKVLGLSYRDNMEVRNNQSRSPICDLDQIPYPDRSTLVNQQYYTHQDLGMILSSRGCPFQCTFCAIYQLWGRGIHYRSIPHVMAEIHEVIENYGVHYFSFRDSVFTINEKRVLELCSSIIKSNLPIQWECMTRMDLMSEQVLEQMKEGGCSIIRVGIESGSPRILEHIRKNISIDQIRTIAKLLHKYEFYWAAYFIFGTPTETEDDIIQTLELIKDIDPPFVTMSSFEPVEGTEMYYEANQLGLIGDNDKIYANRQSIGKCYSSCITQKRYQELMTEVSEFIQRHNKKNAIYTLRIRRLEN